MKPWRFSEIGKVPCETANPDNWFPQSTKQLTVEENAARKLCNTCPFQGECLDYALHHDVNGIWGGSTEIDRARLRVKLGIVATPMSHLGLVPSHKGK